MTDDQMLHERPDGGGPPSMRPAAPALSERPAAVPRRVAPAAVRLVGGAVGALAMAECAPSGDELVDPELRHVRGSGLPSAGHVSAPASPPPLLRARCGRRRTRLSTSS